MLNKSLYNHYIKEVLGIHNYIGKEQQAQTLVEASIKYQNKTIVVTEAEVTPAEQTLLQNIMKAVAQHNYECELLSSFNIDECANCKILFFYNSENKQTPFYQTYSSKSSVCMSSVGLSKMLPPTNETELKANKQKLWNSLKVFLKV